MSGYGNSAKNQLWGRQGQNMAQSGSVPQSLMANPNMLQYPQVFQGQQAAAMGMNMSGLAQTAVAPMQAAMQATSQMYGAVSYPTRALNTAAFQQGQQQQSHQNQQGGQNSGNKQRVFTGTVTKIQDNFGFVDEDVFFQSSCCVKGSTPQVGDKVLVEAVYNGNMPFKWNATRIQVLSMQDGNQHQRSNQSYSNRSQSNYNAVPPPKVNSPAGNRFSSGGSRFSSGGGGDRGGSRGGGGGGGNLRRDEQDRKRRRDDRDKDDKPKSPPRKRSRSPAKPARRQRRPPPRYNVTVPRTSLNGRDGDVVEIKKRYSNMYIPSDFFLSEYRWTDTFPIGKPMSLDFPCAFHVMHKEVDPLEENNAVLEPPDADYIYSAKVMLLASPGLEDLFSKCIILTEERESSKSTVDEDSLSHPSRLIHFLVGTRGKENMAIGGPWSPSEDGENPSSDPSVLVRTAIRTTKALTGIDLSKCTQWFRFVEVHYHRSETVYRGKSYPARVETVVIFVPDVWSCVPTRLEWDDLHLSYQKALARKLNDDEQKEEEDEVAEVEKETSEEQSTEKVKREPKHHSEIDVKNLKVSDLRDELEARNLSSKGLKSQLVARLQKALKTEEEEESKQKATTEEESKKKEDPEKKETDEKKKKEEEEKKKIDEKEKQLLEKRYKLPKKPHIVVHPNRTAKSGKFDCSVQSLTSLLGYRQDDTKEHSFEVSIFAELFNEMLMRDFGFNIYRAVVEAPEKTKEEKSKDEKEKAKEEKDKAKDEKDKEKDKEKSKDDDNDPKKEKDSKSKDKDKEKEKDKDKDKEKDKESSDKDSESKDKEMEVQSETEEQNEEEKEANSKDENSSKDASDSKDKKGDKENREKRAKLITYDKLLLLSFTFFDISRCGYIYDKDIEDLLFSLGLTLSRSQIRKLVSKVVSRDAVYYRRLTDRPEGSPIIEHLPLDQLVGNKLILPSYLADQTEQPVNGKTNETAEVKKGQMIMFNGSLVDVGRIMEQLTRSETTRIETERSLGKLRDELSKLKETTAKSEKYIKDLNSDLRDYRERLAVTNSELSSLQAKERQFVRTLTEISDKIKPLIAKPEPPPKQPEAEVKEVIDLVEEKGEEPMTVDEDK